MQGPTVPGEINLTCDAWQADNTDAYFAVTGHWIKERVPGVWALEHALLGFTQINCSHSGVHLGQMLYKIINQLQILQKARTFTLSDHCLAHLLLVYTVGSKTVAMFEGFGLSAMRRLI